MDSNGTDVVLHVYDLTKGVAAIMSPLLLGHKIDGVWHTAIVVFGREYFYGAEGIQSTVPGGTVLGQPLKVLNLGKTYIPYSVFLDYVLQLGDTTFRGSVYELFHHNCNSFSEEVAQFLCGKSIPKYILELPEKVLNTPFGQSLRPLLESITTGPNIQNIRDTANSRLVGNRQVREPSPDFLDLNSQIEEARLQRIALEERRNTTNQKIAKKERKKDKKRKKLLQNCTNGYSNNSSGSDSNATGFPRKKMSDTEASGVEVNGSGEGAGGGDTIPSEMLPSERVLEQEALERLEEEERKRQRDPPVVYKDIVDVSTEFDALLGLVDGKLSSEEQTAMEELHQYMIGDEGSWALGDGFLNFVGRILNDQSLGSDARIHLLNVLAAAALKDDVILLLHQDRREHVLMNFAQDIDRHPPKEQEALALFMCNLFENLSSSEWLLYISEWSYNGQQTSNIRATTKVAVHCLLAPNDVLQERGAAIVHNLACKEKMHQGKRLRRLLPPGCLSKVFDDVAVELTMAVLQFFNARPTEELLFRCMKALARFCQISGQDVPQLIQMIGPSPATFKGQSQRVDELILQISKKLR